ncbi:MAG: hypothetical protein Q8L89_07145 [Gammaproteobacteria bacterium]|nr:hypothetical protein [Gammaproteobacteria bacterium]
MDLKPKPDIEHAIKYLQCIIPDLDWILVSMQSKGGWMVLPPTIQRAFQNLKIKNYVELYLDEKKLNCFGFSAFLTPDAINELNQELGKITTEEEQTAFLNELIGHLISLDFDGFHIPKTDAEFESACRIFEALSPEDQAEEIRVSQIIWMSLLSNFYNYMALMVHGQKMTALVQQAIAGDDTAFCLAVQIDRTILTNLPYFKERSERAQLAGDADFLDKLAYRIANPVLRGKIRFHSLWLTFALLDGMNLLDTLSHSELLYVCDSAGVGGYNNRIEEVGYISKRLAEYRKFQSRAKKSRQ